MHTVTRYNAHLYLLLTRLEANFTILVESFYRVSKILFARLSALER